MPLRCDAKTYSMIQEIKYLHNNKNPYNKITMIKVVGLAIEKYHKEFTKNEHTK
jgi:hypothetical protein